MPAIKAGANRGAPCEIDWGIDGRRGHPMRGGGSIQSSDGDPFPFEEPGNESSNQFSEGPSWRYELANAATRGAWPRLIVLSAGRSVCWDSGVEWARRFPSAGRGWLQPADSCCCWRWRRRSSLWRPRPLHGSLPGTRSSSVRASRRSGGW